jgi:hypothetical protein
MCEAYCPLCLDFQSVKLSHFRTFSLILSPALCRLGVRSQHFVIEPATRALYTASHPMRTAQNVSAHSCRSPCAVPSVYLAWIMAKLHRYVLAAEGKL